MNTKREVIREHLSRYLEASKEEKSAILNHLTDILKMHRKAVIRAIRREQYHDPWKEYGITKGAPLFYGPDVTLALREVWDISRELCAERLRPIISEYIEILIRDGMWKHPEAATDKLYAISLATLKRRIAGFQRIKSGGGRSTTKPSDLKEIIPIRRGPWDNPEPGYGEIDTVVHCGPTLSGDMAYTVNYTDIATCWMECAAQINKGEKRTKESIEKIKGRLPFPLRGLDPDTGSEFINWFLKRWCDGQNPVVELTRSRPNHKNDNAHIEQKNHAHVRKLLGYSRIDTQEAVDLMNQLYGGPWRLFVNFFQPSQKCVEKVRIGNRYIRKYDEALTPYQRVLEDGRVSEEIKEKLSQQYAKLNPRVLKDQTDDLVRRIFDAQKRLRNH